MGQPNESLQLELHRLRQFVYLIEQAVEQVDEIDELRALLGWQPGQRLRRRHSRLVHG